MNLQKIIRPIVIAALFVIPVFPLIVANSFFFPFITGKAFYFRMLVEVAFFGWVILAFLDAKYRPRLNALTISVTLFTLVTLIADLLGVNPLRSLWSNFERMEGWITIVHLWAFFIAASGIFGSGEEGRRWWHRWFNMSLIFAFFVACYGLAQLFGWAAIHQGSTRIDASLGNSAYMAVYMLISAGIAAYMYFVARARKIANASFLMWAYPILAILFSYELIETATRGTTLGLGIGAIVSMILYGVFADGITRKKIWILVSYVVLAVAALLLSFKATVFSFAPAGSIYSALVLTGFVSLVYLIVFIVFSFKKEGTVKSIRTARGWIAGIFALILILAALFIGLRNAAFVQHNEVLNRIAGISLDDSSGQARQYIWPMALKGAAERPLFGWGQENFNYIFNANYNPHMWGQEQWFDRAHSVFLDWLSASGIVGLVAYLALYVLFLMAIWKSASLSIAEKSVLTGLLVGYIIHNIFVFDNLASYVLFFSMLGFAASFRETEAPALFGTKVARADAVEYIVAPVVIILLVAGIYFINVRPIQANTRLISALQACTSAPDVAINFFNGALDMNAPVGTQEIHEQILSCTGNVIASVQASQVQAEQGLFALAQKSIQDQVAATPKDARIYALGGTFLNQVGQSDQAGALLAKAHALSPGKQTIDFELATAEVNTGKGADAVALLKQAYDSDPSDPDSASAYAVGLVYNGQETEARAIFNNDPTIFETERMASVYVSLKKFPQALAIFQKLAAADPSNVQLAAELAQTQYQAGMITQAIATMRAIEKVHPEYTDNIEAAIKQIQAKPQ